MRNKDILFDENLLIEIFIKADDLCKHIEKEILSHMIENDEHRFDRKKKGSRMSERVVSHKLCKLKSYSEKF